MKRILFVIESLNLGGAEKSLITLLSLIDYEKYEVDLQLFSYGGHFQKMLPKEVHLLGKLPFFNYCSIPYKNIIKKMSNPQYLLSQLKYSVKLRLNNYNNLEKSVVMWESVNNSFNITDKEYDVAVAYAQGVPTFYVADKVKARKKIAWINVTYKPEGRYLKFINKFYKKYDFVNCVSESVERQVSEHLDINSNKLLVIKDILSYDINLKMAQMQEVNVNSQNGLFILTVGRLVRQKGFDLAIEACKILKEKNIKFKWVVIGEGNQRTYIEQKIRDYNLYDEFVLLGAKSNPYPYFEACDIYVQTSRFEGFGITIAEARMFNKPIVTTEFDAVYSQIIPDKNGMIVKMNPEAIANGIEKMINDNEYRNSIIEYLKTEKKDNKEEIEKFYSVIK